MPRLDGMEVCRRVRQTSQLPILMLTARDDEVDKLLGLELGADDYLVKPFSMRELAARMKAILRRTQQKPGSTQEDSLLRCQDLVLDVRRHTAFIGESELPLTPIEFSLLELFLRHPEQVFNRLQLLEPHTVLPSRVTSGPSMPISATCAARWRQQPLGQNTSRRCTASATD